MTLAELPTWPPARSVLAAGLWKNNAEMILAVVELGYIREHDDVVDLTFGRGKWWTRYQPGSLAHSDKWDFTNLPHHLDDRFDVVAFDPAFVSTGGRKTSTIPDFNDRYGVTDAPKNPQLMHEKNMLGLRNAMRVVKPGGLILYKCMDYVSSGTLQMVTHWSWRDAIEMGLTVRDRLILVGHARVQPKGRGQQHARNNFSSLYVLERPR